MSHSSASPDPRRRLLQDVLLAYLQDSVQLWPGGDGLTAEEAVRDYVRAAAEGLVPDQRQLCDRHPELAAELAAFFAEEALLPT
jgi:hypothetical protein